MYMRKGALYLLLIIFLLCLPGCSEKKVIEIPAMVVIDIIPDRVQQNLFAQTILGHNAINDNDIEILNEVYKLDDASGDYIINLEAKGEKKDELLTIFRKISYAPVFSEPRAEKLVTLATEWTEITCLTPEDKPKTAKAQDATGNDHVYEWYKVRAGENEGWILSDYLLFKSFRETEAVVIKYFRIFSVPDCKTTKIVDSCSRGLTITLTGYDYKERNCGASDTSRYSMKMYDKSGWAYEPSVLPDAHLGIILPEEVTLYSAPDDMKQNVVENRVYTKMEIVPIIDILDNEWYKVIYEDKNDSYYIKNGNEAISAKKDDITFASYVREDYVAGKTIINEVLEVKEDDPVQGIAGIENKREKIQQLEQIYENVEKYQEEYPDSIFAGIGPYSLREFLQNLMIAKDSLERTLSAIEESPVPEPEGTTEEYEAEIEDEGGV